LPAHPPAGFACFLPVPRRQQNNPPETQNLPTRLTALLCPQSNRRTRNRRILSIDYFHHWITRFPTSTVTSTRTIQTHLPSRSNDRLAEPLPGQQHLAAHVCLAFQDLNPVPDTDRVFSPVLRLYWPRETPASIINDTWKIPTVQKLKCMRMAR